MIRVTPEILNLLNSLIDDLRYTHDRAKYYDEERKTAEFAEEIQKRVYDIRKIIVQGHIAKLVDEVPKAKPGENPE